MPYRLGSRRGSVVGLINDIHAASWVRGASVPLVLTDLELATQMETERDTSARRLSEHLAVLPESEPSRSDWRSCTAGRVRHPVPTW